MRDPPNKLSTLPLAVYFFLHWRALCSHNNKQEPDPVEVNRCVVPLAKLPSPPQPKPTPYQTAQLKYYISSTVLLFHENTPSLFKHTFTQQQKTMSLMNNSRFLGCNCCVSEENSSPVLWRGDDGNPGVLCGEKK